MGLHKAPALMEGELEQFSSGNSSMLNPVLRTLRWEQKIWDNIFIDVTLEWGAGGGGAASSTPDWIMAQTQPRDLLFLCCFFNGRLSRRL